MFAQLDYITLTNSAHLFYSTYAIDFYGGSN
ncbi:hypothetical protein ES708_09342 [subsurface metagenome]